MEIDFDQLADDIYKYIYPEYGDDIRFRARKETEIRDWLTKDIVDEYGGVVAQLARAWREYDQWQ